MTDDELRALFLEVVKPTKDKPYPGQKLKRINEAIAEIKRHIEYDIVLELRCDWCAEMNEGVGYNPSYKTTFGCRSCGKLNKIHVLYKTERLDQVTDLPTEGLEPSAGHSEAQSLTNSIERM